ncbi:putative fungal protein of unknown function (DUF1752) [Lyophyllum shimeji]|uniref:Nitrogen regulatory protein areA GATA-like domain-containing protein n=1 Tax=Lyophyllum shimeji TaxID=47721 RepID=A0A9P3UQV9_LYOSH|nr:putative fungal protein of unknown function (DUF1752) [Lyophyllum shimeji]
MANYLPVLLVSVASNSIPDDSSVSTLPRGQVDYLSHNWQEEDVWRSWRNMTRQKNEIANGVRLENASWRTWWKQRNGLGTVTPETLNWLKDSDVTWLYGPLHTAVDWSPPPKPLPMPDTANLDLPNASAPPTKPILKHRSISELLTSELPTSPIFSPAESEDEAAYPSHPLPLQLPEEPGGATKPRRPPLTHTKSDTHITRWGPNRAFRKDSPPRIDPPTPGAVAYSPTNLEGYFSNSNQSSDSANALSAAQSHSTGQSQKKRHISFNTFVEQCIAIEKPKKRSDVEDDDDDGGDDDDEEEFAHRGVAGRYPYGRNPWGYDDGYEEDAEEDSDDDAEAVSLSMWDQRYNNIGVCSDSDSYDGEGGVGEEEGANEEEEGDGVIEMRSSFGSRTKPSSPRSQSIVSTASCSSSASTSTSVSNSNSSGSPDGHIAPQPQRRLSTSTNSTYRPRIHRPSPSTTSSSGSRRTRRGAPPLIRTSATDRSDATSPTPQPTHVTIAPIAPTILKTGTNGYYGHAPGGWVEGFGDEGGSDDGIWGGGGSRWWGTGAAVSKGKGRTVEESEEEDGQTPVELVYVPPFGSNYSLRVGREKEREQRMFAREREWEAKERDAERAVTRSRKEAAREVMEDHEDGFGNDDQDVYRRRGTLFRVGDGDDDADADADGGEPTVRGVHMGAPIPKVVVPRDAYDYFEGPDLGEDFPPRRSSSSSLVRTVSGTEITRGRGAATGSPGQRDEVEQRGRSKSRSQSRSRSRSTSRTPSPALISPSTSLSTGTFPSGPQPHVHAPVPVPARRSKSGSPPTSVSAPVSASGSLLSPPPMRGRGSYSHQDLGQAQREHTRGRSSTRTSSSFSDRERSTGQHSSSIGSLSPDGLELGNVAAAYAGGRTDRERERERERDRERRGDRERERSRGRDRSETKRLSQSHSASPDGVRDSLLRVSPASTVPVQQQPASVTDQQVPRLGLATKSTASSSSSSSSCSTSSTMTIVPQPIPVAAEAVPVVEPIPIDVRRAEEQQRSLQPTPSNSPIISMEPVPPAISVPSLNKVPGAPPYTTKIKSPLSVPAPHPVEPSTSYSISPPRVEQSAPSSPKSPRSPASPTKGEPTIAFGIILLRRSVSNIGHDMSDVNLTNFQVVHSRPALVDD